MPLAVHGAMSHPRLVAKARLAVAEGDAGQMPPVTLTYVNSPASPQTITGTYQTVDGTATVADNDYLEAHGTWVIPANETTSNPITVIIVGDAKVEADESFTLGGTTTTAQPPFTPTSTSTLPTANPPSLTPPHP